MNQDQLQELLATSRRALEFMPTELGSARALRFVLTQTFSYRYSAPISGLRQRLLAFPPAAHGDQVRIFHRLSVQPPGPEPEWSLDSFGNLVAGVRVPLVDASVLFTVEAVIERSTSSRNQPWNEKDAARFLAPTPLTNADDAIVAAARDARAGAFDDLRVAERISEAVHRHVRYQKGVTSVASSAAEVFALGAGVCQDHAHLMLAMCRAVGIPARYVSGHLLGEGSTHAWVEVLARPQSAGAPSVAFPFDPCHGRIPDSGYITVALGRDYADVPPTSGTYNGVAANRLTSSTLLGVTLVD